MRNIYDRTRAGTLRATADGVTGNPVLRVNMTISSTSMNTTSSTRATSSTALSAEWSSRQGSHFATCASPRQGKYDESLNKKLDEYMARLAICKGSFVIKSLNKLVDKMAEDMASLADLVDDDTLWDVSKRSLVLAPAESGCPLWILNKQTWTKAMGELVEWPVYHDLWSKTQLFADLIGQDAEGTNEAQRRGPKNLLDQTCPKPSTSRAGALRLLAASQVLSIPFVVVCLTLAIRN